MEPYDPNEKVLVLTTWYRKELEEFLEAAQPEHGTVSAANAIRIRCGKLPLSRGAPVGNKNNPKGRTPKKKP